MELLDAINLCVTMAGFDPVTLVSSNASSDSARAKDTIQRVRRRILTRGYDFNTNIVSLAVDADGRVPIPSSWLRYELPRTTAGDLLTQKIDNGQLFVWNTQENDFHGEGVDDVKVVFDVLEENFKYIPDPFAQWIAYESAVEYVRERKNNVDQSLIAQAQLNAANALNSQTPRDFNITTGAYRRLAGFYANGSAIDADLLAE